MNQQRKLAEDIFLAGVARVRPDRLIHEHLQVRGDELLAGGQSFDLRTIRNLFVVGAGKASAFMAKAVEAILGERISAGHVVVKYGHGCELRRIQVTEAGHPHPDANGFAGTKKILQLAEQATADDLVLCLWSGGGSALLADGPAEAQPDDLMALNRLLVRSGADITEINAVRKHLSRVKGGQLAKAIAPARCVSLILSDVIGDPLDVIASGPTAPDTSTFADAWRVVETHQLADVLPPALARYLKDGLAGRHAETAKADDPAFHDCRNVIIGNNRLALEASRQRAMALGFAARIADAALSGDTVAAAKAIVRSALAVQRDYSGPRPICLLFGGETTLQISGTGLGGRNQHLALVAAQELQSKPGITVLAAGTDGTDGPTIATGAVVDDDTIACAKAAGLDPERSLRDFDSYHFFQRAGGQIITGPTRTNVMDMVVVLVAKPTAEPSVS